jgi:hypothetical protein
VRASSSSRTYGLLASFETPEDLVAAARRAREAGYERLEGYSPFPVHGLSEAVGFRETKIPWIIFASGLIGAVGGFALQWYVSVVDYPLNVGGRPLLSWPHFVPVTFECTVLLAAFGAIVSLFGLCGLPRPHHPLFSVPAFLRASQDGFFLCIEAGDTAFDAEETRRFLESLGALNVEEVLNDDAGY